jgi:hypothetical protein
MSNLRHAVHSLFKGAVERITPPLQKSAFEEKGVRASSTQTRDSDPGRAGEP